jgi:hypothetical protein
MNQRHGSRPTLVFEVCDLAIDVDLEAARVRVVANGH